MISAMIDFLAGLMTVDGIAKMAVGAGIALLAEHHKYLCSKNLLKLKYELGGNPKKEPEKLTWKERRSVFTVRMHFKFLRTDSYPRSPICPDCQRKKRKAYLFAQYVSPTNEEPLVLKCPHCEYTVDLNRCGVRYPELQKLAE